MSLRVRVSGGHLCAIAQKHRPNRQVRQLSALPTEGIKERVVEDADPYDCLVVTIRYYLTALAILHCDLRNFT